MRNLIKVLEKISDRKIKDLKKELAKKDKNATGNLINSLGYVLEIKEDKGELNIEVDANDYYKYIESGRKPGSKFPPKKPIADWMTARGIDKKLEYIIRRSIAKNGIKPTQITEVIFSESELKKLQDEIETAYKKDLDELLEKAIKKINK